MHARAPSLPSPPFALPHPHPLGLQHAFSLSSSPIACCRPDFANLLKKNNEKRKKERKKLTAFQWTLLQREEEGFYTSTERSYGKCVECICKRGRRSVRVWVLYLTCFFTWVEQQVLRSKQYWSLRGSEGAPPRHLHLLTLAVPCSPDIHNIYINKLMLIRHYGKKNLVHSVLGFRLPSLPCSWSRVRWRKGKIRHAGTRIKPPPLNGLVPPPGKPQVSRI